MRTKNKFVIKSKQMKMIFGKNKQNKIIFYRNKQRPILIMSTMKMKTQFIAVPKAMHLSRKI
jgi:hypothetical protein